MLITCNSVSHGHAVGEGSIDLSVNQNEALIGKKRVNTYLRVVVVESSVIVVIVVACDVST